MKLHAFGRQADTFTALDHQIEFTKEGNGGFKALVPLRLPNSGTAGDNRSFITTVPLSIIAEQTVSAKNRTRILLKVTLPYTAISPDVSDDSVVANQFNTGRSGGEVEMHVVLSVPAAMAQDFKGTYGSTCTRGAQAHLALVRYILSQLLGLQSVLPSCFLDGSDGTTVKTTPSIVESLSDTPTGGTGVAVTTDKVTDITKNMTPPIYAEQIGGAIGLDLSDTPNFQYSLRDPITRGLMKVSPLDEASELHAVAHQALATS